MGIGGGRRRRNRSRSESGLQGGAAAGVVSIYIYIYVCVFIAIGKPVSSSCTTVRSSPANDLQRSAVTTDMVNAAMPENKGGPLYPPKASNVASS